MRTRTAETTGVDDTAYPVARAAVAGGAGVVVPPTAIASDSASRHGSENALARHQYIDRSSGDVLDEHLFGDRVVSYLYSTVRESAPAIFRALTSARMSKLLATLNFDLPLAPSLLGNTRFLARTGVDLGECVAAPSSFTTPRKIFERQIRYWDCRPMSSDAADVVSPADGRLVVGSLAETSALFLKGKFFDLTELIGGGRARWQEAFAKGDFAIVRLTPDKYHYNHTPVAGTVLDIYELDGVYHSCNPQAVLEIATPYSKNRRVVTVLQTDVPGGSQVGLVAMIEVTALMIGEVVQCYSAERYLDSRPVERGMFLVKGAPKSLYRPGSSTDVLLFEPGRVRFADDLLRNQRRSDVQSRYAAVCGHPLVETEVRVRATVARRCE